MLKYEVPNILNSILPAFTHMAYRVFMFCVKIIDEPNKKLIIGLIIESLETLSISLLETFCTSSLMIYKYASSLFESNMLMPAMTPSKSDTLESKLDPKPNT